MKNCYNTNQVKRNPYLRMAFLMFMVFLMVGQLKAQDGGCYAETKSKGIKAMKNKEYDKAIKFFETAQLCPDLPTNNDLDSKIKECKQRKQQLDNEKKEAEERKQREAELKRQAALEQQLEEERERMAMEAEMERQREEEERLAKKGYMDVTGIDFLNSNESGQALSQPGTDLYDDDVQYIQPNITYDGLSDEEKEVMLYMKYIKPDGNLLRVADAPEGYSTSQMVTVYPGENKKLVLTGVGSKTTRFFPHATYRFELWCQGNRIYSTSFTTIKTPPKTIMVNLSVPDNASIYVNGRYKGSGSYRESLPFGSYTIVCTKEGHRQTSTTLTLSEGMSEQNIRLEAPTPMYGSILVKSKPKKAEVYVDGKWKGETPTTCDKLLVGEHSIKLEKKGYSPYETTISIEEDITLNREFEMKKLPYRNRFASFFLDGVVGNLSHTDDLMIGGNIALCPRHVGFYGQYMHGIKHSSYLATGGLVFRLTRDYVDFQLMAGAGYGKAYTSNSYYNGLMFDVGGRIGWRSSLNWSMFDIMGGCVISKDGKFYPYAGAGTAISLVAVLASLKALLK